MGRELDVYAMGSTRFYVGTSAIVQVGPTDNQLSLTLKLFSGNSLEIVSRPAALSGSSAAGWGIGYMIGASEVVNVSGPARYYLAATGATAQVHVLIGYSQGATIGAPL